MDYSQPFSELNEKLRPCCSATDQIYSSLNRLEIRNMNRSRFTAHMPTILTDPEPNISMTAPEGPPKPRRTFEQEEMVCDDRGERNLDVLTLFTALDAFDGLSFTELDSEELNNDNSSSTQSEETDSTGELVLDGTRDSPEAEAGVGESSFQRYYTDKSLPDLIKSGRPLCRRRTVGHVSETVGKQVFF